MNTDQQICHENKTVTTKLGLGVCQSGSWRKVSCFLEVTDWIQERYFRPFNYMYAHHPGRGIQNRLDITRNDG